jgi:hypothetical protein
MKNKSTPKVNGCTHGVHPFYIVMGIIAIACAGYIFGRWLKDVLN